jgi:hypothetical protein
VPGNGVRFIFHPSDFVLLDRAVQANIDHGEQDDIVAGLTPSAMHYHPGTTPMESFCLQDANRTRSTENRR